MYKANLSWRGDHYGAELDQAELWGVPPGGESYLLGSVYQIVIAEKGDAYTQELAVVVDGRWLEVTPGSGNHNFKLQLAH